MSSVPVSRRDLLKAGGALVVSFMVPGAVSRAIGQGAAGLKKYGIPANSGAVHGARYNARVLAGRIAETRFGRTIDHEQIANGDVLPFCLDELQRSPELWHQRAYLASVVTVTPQDGIRHGGIVPLSTFLDDGGPDGVALTIEADGTGAIYPAIYLRRHDAVEEHLLPPNPLLDFRTSEHRQQLAAILDRLGLR